jgi:hypothetical protein
MDSLQVPAILRKLFESLKGRRATAEEIEELTQEAMKLPPQALLNAAKPFDEDLLPPHGLIMEALTSPVIDR